MLALLSCGASPTKGIMPLPPAPHRGTVQAAKGKRDSVPSFVLFPVLGLLESSNCVGTPAAPASWQGGQPRGAPAHEARQGKT